MSGHRLALAAIAGTLAYALALQAPPPAGLILAPILAAIAAQIAETPASTALAGLVAGLAGFLLAAAAAGSLGGLWLIPATGGVMPLVLTGSYHLVAPAALAAAIRLIR